ncbi:MAG: SAM-dependent methyltransferase [Saprospiraceae bacterium]|nr:MAG: SAM-dependent methyltransferase [Saprospiraceae bacterium]
MYQIVLKPGKDQPLRRFHPWVFSGAVARLEGDPQDGDVVEVLDHRGNFLAMGHYHAGNIAVRILSFQKEKIDESFWLDRLQAAAAMRLRLGLPSPGRTTCFRLVHGEGDGLPGLVIDVYEHTAVLQCHSIGMHKARQALANALVKLEGLGIRTVFDKSAETLPSQYATQLTNEYLVGSPQQAVVLENGIRFKVDWEQGQKTGFFLDQRPNRELLARYVRGRSVLNAFSYSGGFSMYALGAGAALVHSVDASGRAVEWCRENVVLNGFEPSRHEAFVADVLPFLKQCQMYDVVVVDPPAFAKSMAKRHKAVMGYKRLNAAALQRVNPGGLLFTFSCSQVVDRDLFYNTIVAAALEAGRLCQVLHHLSQGPDHPVHIFHPEGAYLKGLVLYVK